ncbi:MAG TPA: flagellar type III secretion system pore protein FliP [Rhizomicrobium sp.]|nr:flagellar type III secretion system pore protein FliP [Rhizomicrobium sp.]
MILLLKRLLPFLLVLGLALPHAAYAQRLRMTPPNSPAAVASQASAATSTPANGGLSIDLNGNGLFTDRMLQIVALITVLSIAPSIIIMMTSFVRIVVVLSLLRTAMGLQQSPPNSVIVSLAMFLTLFVMTPTLTDAYHQGIQPMMNNQVTTEQGFTQALVPMKKFMLAHVRGADLKLFSDMAKQKPTNDPAQVAVTTLAPAFMLSELKRAFEIGFLIFVPFLIIDMAVASILMSMGMMMLPPVIISLPFKLIFFVLVDGWRLVAGSLVQSYMHSPPPT